MCVSSTSSHRSTQGHLQGRLTRRYITMSPRYVEGTSSQTPSDRVWDRQHYIRMGGKEMGVHIPQCCQCDNPFFISISVLWGRGDGEQFSWVLTEHWRTNYSKLNVISCLTVTVGFTQHLVSYPHQFAKSQLWWEWYITWGIRVYRETIRRTSK